ncbi:unnamed protein product, partial [Polarella glacialis]
DTQVRLILYIAGGVVGFGILLVVLRVLLRLVVEARERAKQARIEELQAAKQAPKTKAKFK